MWKEYKKKLLLSSAVILSPMAAGILLWNRLPDHMATHWGVDGNVDGWAGKGFAVFGGPLLLLAMHIFCLWITCKDPNQKHQGKKARNMIFWIMPAVSLFCAAVLYGAALGGEINITTVAFAMLGLMFMGIGNYLPKIRRNYTLGIKVYWTIYNDENWNATHRFGGRIWFLGGLVMLLLAFFPQQLPVGMIVPLILIMTLLPVAYSYRYYKKQCARDGGFQTEKSFRESGLTQRMEE